MKASDTVFLKETLKLAEHGRFTCAPNPTVGCLIVRGGRIIGRGWHQRAGEAHAEVAAINDAGGQVRGSTVYVSLEPCAFVGRTPACSATLIEQGVARVVAALEDPHAQVAGAGFDMLRRAGIEVAVADMPEARQVIAGYCQRILHNKPLVRLKTASSVDGAVALADGSSQWITGAAARADVQYWRARSDAIVTGAGTVCDDDPQLNVRDYAAVKQPLRVILDPQARVPRSAKVLTDGGATLWLTRAAQQDLSVGVENLVFETNNLDKLLNLLADRGCNEVLVEAGPTLIGSFLELGCWDEWLAYVAPKVMGQDAQSLASLVVNDMASTYNATLSEVRVLEGDARFTLKNVSA